MKKAFIALILFCCLSGLFTGCRAEEEIPAPPPFIETAPVPEPVQPAFPDPTNEIAIQIEKARDPGNAAWDGFIQNMIGNQFSGYDEDPDVSAAFDRVIAASLDPITYSVQSVDTNPDAGTAVATIEVQTYNVYAWTRDHQDELARRAFVLPIGQDGQKKLLLSACDAVVSTMDDYPPETESVRAVLSLRYDADAGCWQASNPEVLTDAAKQLSRP